MSNTGIAPGERNLQAALASLGTSIDSTDYVFAFIPDPQTGELPAIAQQVLPQARLFFREEEGITLVIPKALAESTRIECSFPCRMITLMVNTSLELVGFMAVIANKLKEVEIPCNVVAGYHHDHLFVPDSKVDATVQLLAELAKEARKHHQI